MKKFIADIRIAEGTTCEPNNPNIVHTKENIVSPPPILKEYFVRFYIPEHIKQYPEIANIVKNAPKLNSSISP